MSDYFNYDDDTGNIEMDECDICYESSEYCMCGKTV